MKYMPAESPLITITRSLLSHSRVKNDTNGFRCIPRQTFVVSVNFCKFRYCLTYERVASLHRTLVLFTLILFQLKTSDAIFLKIVIVDQTL